MAAASVAWQALEHGDVLVLANGGGEELGSCAVRDAACARARKESPEKHRCARGSSRVAAGTGRQGQLYMPGYVALGPLWLLHVR